MGMDLPPRPPAAVTVTATATATATATKWQRPCVLPKSLALLLLHAAAAMVLLQPAHSRRDTVTGSGATLANSMMSSLTQHINKRYKVNIRYKSVGAGPGIQELISSSSLFSVAAYPMSVADEARMLGAAKLTLPHCIVTATVFTSLPGNTVVRLDAPTLAGIFQRSITRWNNAAIAALNPGTVLPNKKIVVVVRGDSAGTTYLFSQWLFKVAGGAWLLGYGGQLSWPKGVRYGTSDSGVLRLLVQYPYAITYGSTGGGIALGLNEAAIKNFAGNFIKASTSSVSSAVPRTLPPSIASWSSVSLLSKGGRNTWPITSFLYVFTRKNQVQVGAPGGVLKAWLLYLFSPSLQPLLQAYYFTPCPPSVLNKNIAAIQTLQLSQGAKVPGFS